DVIIIGAGIAGLSAAGEISKFANVIVLEAESQPAYHSTGRSAALFIEPYENDVVWALTVASGAFLKAPPEGFSDTALLRLRRGLMIADAQHAPSIDRYIERWGERCPGLHEVSLDEALAMVPLINTERVARTLEDPGIYDIDVHALLQGFLGMVRASGGRLNTDARVTSLTSQGDGWRVSFEGGEFEAPIVVNAAGSWGGEIGRLAGAGDLGLTPMRRSAALVAPPADVDIDGWPVVHSAGGGLYFKPEAGKLMVSPADATPSEPCDAQPDELDIAIALDRFRNATHIPVERIEHRWAGLRSFVADGLPVVGFDPERPGFFWLVGQGGFGVQTSPAMGRVAAELVQGNDLPDDLLQRGVTAAQISPAREGIAS
ncbi:MAG: FAD-binding oxidoreductase, partial [Pseudomonadales bacterium]